MLKQLKTSILALVLLIVGTGLLYPLAITAIGQTLFPQDRERQLDLREGWEAGRVAFDWPAL